MKGNTDSQFSCVVHRWGRSRITRGITAVLLLSVVGMGLYLLVQGILRVVAGASILTLPAAAGGVLSNYFWLASICFGFIATLRYTVYKEISSCDVW